jgi:hypothetical protein
MAKTLRMMAIATTMTLAGSGTWAAPDVHVGHPRILPDGRRVRVPIELTQSPDDDVAALNFTLRYPADRLHATPNAVVAGPAVTNADGDFVSRVDAARGAVTVLVVPEFSPEFRAMRGRRLAVITFDLDGNAERRLARRLRSQMALEDVAFGDSHGRNLHRAQSKEGR